MMPLGHAAMILLEYWLTHEYVYIIAALLGGLGIIFLFIGIFSKVEISATLWGVFGALFVWTGWVEFGFMYYADRFNVDPVIENGEIVTKPEYLIMPATIGLYVIFMLYYLFGTKTGCTFFSWFQRKMKLKNKIELKPAPRNTALTSFMELTMLLWTFYLLLLFAYDSHFFGDRHPVTYVIALGSLLWSSILFYRLLKIKSLAYAIRYAMPTVIIFWNFVEIFGRWGVFKEIWVEPTKYMTEVGSMLAVLIILVIFAILSKKKNRKTTSK